MKYVPPPPPRFDAFTVRANGGILNRIMTEVGVSLPFDPKTHSGANPPVHRTSALWDTGASGSVITKATAQALNLRPTSMTRMTHAGGTNDANVYLVNLYLPNRVLIHTVSVSEMADNSDFGVLIGMDIITLGDFSITNVNRITVVSFRYPSVAEIDYVSDSKRINMMGQPKANIGRNDPCPCGSGRKYKNCHGH